MRRWFFLVLIIILTVSYSFLCFSTYKINKATTEHFKVTDEYVNQQIQKGLLGGGTYFQSLAEKLQRYPHDRETVTRAYAKAVVKAPANQNVWLAYAQYLARRGCCEDQVLKLFSGIVRLARMKPDRYVAAGSYLLSIGRKKEALHYFGRSLQLDPRSGSKIYTTLEKEGFSIRDLMQIAPKDPDGLLELAQYLKSRKTRAREDLVEVLESLAKMTLNDKQRLSLAREAFQVRLLPLATEQALRIHGPVHIEGQKFQLLADIALQENDWKRYSRFALLAIQNFRAAGEAKTAVRYAVQVAWELSKVESWERTKQRFEVLIKDFPDHADGYYHLARWIEKESPELFLKYLETAVKIEPENFLYADLLANRYIQLSRFSEAETIYRSFLNHRRYHDRAYVMVAKTKILAGRSSEAASFLETNAESPRKSKRALLDLAKLHEEMGDYRKAAEAYRHLAELQPNRIEPYLKAANAYRKAGDLEAARQLYKHALDIDPGNSRVIQAMNSLEVAD